MKYVQFFNRGMGMNKTLYQAIGDRSVIILDARQRELTHHKIAMDEQERRGYDAYQFFKGDSFTTAKPVSGVYMDIALLKAGYEAETA